MEVIHASLFELLARIRVSAHIRRAVGRGGLCALLRRSALPAGDAPAATEWDISAELSKRITEDLGISIGETWTNIHQPGGFTQAGFHNLETTLQYQLLKDGPHELALLLGLIVDWGGTGAIDSGLATPWSTLTPTFYFGKGFGDLPD